MCITCTVHMGINCIQTLRVTVALSFIHLYFSENIISCQVSIRIGVLVDGRMLELTEGQWTVHGVYLYAHRRPCVFGPVQKYVSFWICPHALSWYHNVCRR